MANFTSNTYQMKRKILSFVSKISIHLAKPEKKFTADITYGMLASGSCLLTDVCDQLHEPSKKINVVDRLSRHLEKGTPAPAASSYLQQVKKWVPAEPVVHIDDSDVVKPDGHKFEALGIVRDGSESTSTKSKATTSQKHVYLHAATIRPAFFPEYILLLKKIINLQTWLRSRPWNRGQPSLAKQLLPWTGATMTIRCS